MTTKPPYYAFGRRVAVARKALNMTQRALAAKVGLTAVYMCRIERGRNMPSIDTMTRIATVLHVSRGELLR